MTTTIPILAQCAVCDALLAAHELTAHPAHSLICADRGGCFARKRDRRATTGKEAA